MLFQMLRFGKKGIEFLTNWAAILFIVVLVLSFLLSIVIVNPWVNYGIVIFAGVVLGYFIAGSRYNNRFPYYVLSFALMAGYNLGLRAGSRLVLLVAFVAALVATVKAKQLLE